MPSPWTPIPAAVFFAGLKRTFGGGSFFVTDFTATGKGHVAFAPRFPGTIIAEELREGESLICRKETFLVAQKIVTLVLAWQNRIGSGFFRWEWPPAAKVNRIGYRLARPHRRIDRAHIGTWRASAGSCRSCWASLSQVSVLIFRWSGALRISSSAVKDSF